MAKSNFLFRIVDVLVLDISNLKKSLTNLDLLVREISDVLECGIENTLLKISSALLCYSSSELIDPHLFVKDTETLCETKASMISM